MSDEPRLTQVMIMNTYTAAPSSEFHYRVLADGAETGIVRVVRREGGPPGAVTADVLRRGGEEFDLLATGGVGMAGWVLAHAEPAGEGRGEG